MFQEMLYLLDHGVPWNILKSWSRARRMAACIITAERDGHVFDWSRRQYRE
ncbi:hypothetical protein NBRC3257_1572 [Gluconobacter thailandicus NBRC 3257]|uniref:Transposase n=1 Tax=Gluconobacter thailandicus NBRC 3257 TaxID=1381097 RepID=A0ABQ0IWJ0_GLUTH|nr:hypothetical protein B932_0912 [Gluconobacter oxydans H24]GAC87904.1 hypothetical protein NBRC3255_1565 [Gluconobacter thailandicus NBRC 3255]GAD26573.1 hypothetical protein NBRC3257_1572 [Gluconobacter thailandicus NBRC 3257]